MDLRRVDAGARVDFVAFIDLDLPNGFMRHCRHLADLLKADGYTTTFIGYSDRRASGRNLPIGGVYGEFLRSSRLFLRALFRIVTGGGLVVLSTQANHLQPLLATVAWLKRRPILYDMQDPTPESFERLYRGILNPLLLRAGVGWLGFSERLICRAAKVICVVSPGMRSLVGDRTGTRNKIFLFPNTHSIAEVPSSRRFRLPTIIYAGGFQPLFRGIETQLEAISLASADAWNLLLAGEGPTEWLEAIIRTRHLEKRARILGFISPRRVQGLLRRCHVCIVEGIEYGLPSKFFECVAAGVVIVSPISAVDINGVLGASARTFDGTPVGLGDVLSGLQNDLGALRVSQRKAVADFLARAGDEVRLFQKALGPPRNV